MDTQRYYFSTRDLLMMAALAALGGVVSTYVNAVGDFAQSIVGFAGTTQWAAGLHVLWLTLAVGLVGKPGTGTATGILKGGVELLSGNTHGLLVVLVDVVAGLLVDVGFWPFRDRKKVTPYLVAGGLASISNVFVFQLFASLPADLLTSGVMLIVGGVAFLSGALFAGVLSWTLLKALRRAGLVREAPTTPQRRAHPALYAAFAALTLVFALVLRAALTGPPTVRVGGAVAAPYAYPAEHADIPLAEVQAEMRDVAGTYAGVPLAEVIARAKPQTTDGMLLVRAADGYAFFISMDELRENPALLLSPQGRGDEATYNVVGAESSKAWVRGVSELIVVEPTRLEITGALAEPAPYDPDAWKSEMDSIPLDLGQGTQKLQGTPLGPVLAALEPRPGAATVVLHAPDQTTELPLDEVLGDDDLRIFTVVSEEDVRFAVAWMDGTVLVPRVTSIEVRE